MSDLDKKLDEAIMETIWIRAIDKSEQQKVHPKWFTANGQMFTFGVDVDRIKQVLRDVVNSGNGYGELNSHLMTGQEAFEKLEKAGLLGHDLEIAREALGVDERASVLEKE